MSVLRPYVAHSAPAVSLVTLFALTTPSAVVDYDTVGVDATWTDIAVPVQGFMGVATNATGNSIKAKTRAVAAGAHAAPTAGGTLKWRIRANGPIADFFAFGLDLNGGLVPHAAFVVQAVSGVLQVNLVKYTDTVTVDATQQTANLKDIFPGVGLIGTDLWFGLSRAGTTITYWLSLDGVNDWTAVFTSNDTTDIGLASWINAGPLLETCTATAGTSRILVTSSPAAA